MSKPKLVSSIESLNKIRDSAEVAIVDTVSGFIPWLAPIIPAYVSYSHILNVLQFPLWIAFASALVVEGLGFATVSTAVEFQNWNITKVNREADPRRRKYQAAPTWGAIFTVAFYMAIVLTVNVILDLVTEPNIILFQTGGFTAVAPVLAKSASIFLLSNMTIVGAYTIAIRTRHRQHRIEVENGTEHVAQRSSSAMFSNQNKQAIYNYVTRHRDWIANKSATAEAIGVSRPTLDKYLAELEEEGYI
jgi:hypothetical protein